MTVTVKSSTISKGGRGGGKSTKGPRIVRGRFYHPNRSIAGKGVDGKTVDVEIAVVDIDGKQRNALKIVYKDDGYLLPQNFLYLRDDARKHIGYKDGDYMLLKEIDKNIYIKEKTVKQ